MIHQTASYARAGLIGNPSDGYFGKTLSFTMTNFKAEVALWESPRLQFLPCAEDDAAFGTIGELLDEVALYGYYGGIRLLKAATKVFAFWCHEAGIPLPRRNFSVSYTSNIPRLVGMAGSSAIVTAMIKALCRFYEVTIPKPMLPTLALRVETEELGLQAGLQDRVVQIYDGLVFMDFREDLVTGRGYGNYDYVDPALLPKLYVAYDPKRAEVSGRYHRKLRVLFDQHQQEVVDAMAQFADYAQQGVDALRAGHPEQLPALIDANFDLRDRIFNVADANRNMVLAARAAGASAKFAGSGGAIVGTYEDNDMYVQLERRLASIGCRTFRPTIPEPAND